MPFHRVSLPIHLSMICRPHPSCQCTSVDSHHSDCCLCCLQPYLSAIPQISTASTSTHQAQQQTKHMNTASTNINMCTHFICVVCRSIQKPSSDSSNVARQQQQHLCQSSISGDLPASEKGSSAGSWAVEQQPPTQKSGECKDCGLCA